MAAGSVRGQAAEARLRARLGGRMHTAYRRQPLRLHEVDLCLQGAEAPDDEGTPQAAEAPAGVAEQVSRLFATSFPDKPLFVFAQDSRRLGRDNSSRFMPVSPWRKNQMSSTSVTSCLVGTLLTVTLLLGGAQAAAKSPAPVMANPCGPQLAARCGKNYTPYCAQWKSVVTGGKTRRCCVKTGCRYAPVIK